MILNKIVYLGKTIKQKTIIANILFWVLMPFLLLFAIINYMIQFVIILLEIFLFILSEISFILVWEFNIKNTLRELKNKITSINYKIRDKKYYY